MLRWVLLGLLLPTLAFAQVDERAGLADERRVLSERFAAEERACRERFVVTSCVGEVRIRRRQALAPLRERELKLEEEQRRIRVQQRAAVREAKAARPPATRVAEQPRAAPTPESLPVREAVAPRQPDDAAGRAAQAAERARASLRRAQEVQQSQSEIARRLAERESSGKQATPLPAPVADSVPAR